MYSRLSNYLIVLSLFVLSTPSISQEIPADKKALLKEAIKAFDTCKLMQQPWAENKNSKTLLAAKAKPWKLKKTKLPKKWTLKIEQDFPIVYPDGEKGWNQSTSDLKSAYGGTFGSLIEKAIDEEISKSAESNAQDAQAKEAAAAMAKMMLSMAAGPRLSKGKETLSFNPNNVAKKISMAMLLPGKLAVLPEKEWDDPEKIKNMLTDTSLAKLNKKAFSSALSTTCKSPTPTKQSIEALELATLKALYLGDADSVKSLEITKDGLNLRMLLLMPNGSHLVRVEKNELIKSGEPKYFLWSFETKSAKRAQQYYDHAAPILVSQKPVDQIEQAIKQYKKNYVKGQSTKPEIFCTNKSSNRRCVAFDNKKIYKFPNDKLYSRLKTECIDKKAASSCNVTFLVGSRLPNTYGNRSDSKVDFANINLTLCEIDPKHDCQLFFDIDAETALKHQDIWKRICSHPKSEVLCPKIARKLVDAKHQEFALSLLKLSCENNETMYIYANPCEAGFELAPTVDNVFAFSKLPKLDQYPESLEESNYKTYLRKLYDGNKEALKKLVDPLREKCIASPPLEAGRNCLLAYYAIDLDRDRYKTNQAQSALLKACENNAWLACERLKTRLYPKTFEDKSVFDLVKSNCESKGSMESCYYYGSFMAKINDNSAESILERACYKTTGKLKSSACLQFVAATDADSGQAKIAKLVKEFCSKPGETCFEMTSRLLSGRFEKKEELPSWFQNDFQPYCNALIGKVPSTKPDQDAIVKSCHFHPFARYVAGNSPDATAMLKNICSSEHSRSSYWCNDAFSFFGIHTALIGDTKLFESLCNRSNSSIDLNCAKVGLYLNYRKNTRPVGEIITKKYCSNPITSHCFKLANSSDIAVVVYAARNYCKMVRKDKTQPDESNRETYDYECQELLGQVLKHPDQQEAVGKIIADICKINKEICDKMNAQIKLMELERPVFFVGQTEELEKNAEAVIKKISKYIVSANMIVQIEGHTDERGSTEDNLGLGERRARLVKEMLEKYGVPSDRISTISYGEEKPIDSGHDEAAWAKNARVEFQFSGQ